MRAVALASMMVAVAACGSGDDDGDPCDEPDVCDSFDAPPADNTFTGTWEAQRVETARDCALDVDPRLDVRILIEGNATDGYTAVAADNIGSPGNGGTLGVVDGQQQLAISFQEYWPGFGSQPDVAPGVLFRLRTGGPGLVGTSQANAYYSVNSELVHCTFDFTLTATRVSGP